MEKLRSDIDKIEFSSKNEELLVQLASVFQLISDGLDKKDRIILKHDFDQFKKKGRWIVYKTFAGGIIFLREPEIIENIKIKFNSNSNEAIPSVEYASENRNSRNTKYKLNAGKIESITWNMLGIFPHFNKYTKSIKIILMMIIGKIVKSICEHYKKNSWFMEFEKCFGMELFLDGNLELTYNVKVD